MPCRASRAYWYPPERGRGGGAPPAAAEKYERSESAEASPASAVTFDPVITFSGRPDTITLFSRTAGAVFRLADRVGRVLDDYEVGAGQVVETHVSADQVLARRVAPADTPTVRVTGKWAALGESA